MLGLIQQAIDASISTYNSNATSRGSKEGTLSLTPSTVKHGAGTSSDFRNYSDLDAHNAFSVHNAPQRSPDNGSNLRPKGTFSVPSKLDKGKFPATDPLNTPPPGPPASIPLTDFDVQSLEYSSHPSDLGQGLDDIIFSSQYFDSGIAGDMSTAQDFLTDGWDLESNWLAN
jgi:hypothetical protein